PPDRRQQHRHLAPSQPHTHNNLTLSNMRKKRTYTLNGESPTITEEVIDRFEQNVDTSTPDGCWPWTGKPHQGSGGRGRFTAHGITDYAYRWMACLLGFLLNEKDVVNHKCNNPICV